MGKSTTKRVANAYTFCATKRWEKVVNKTSSKTLTLFNTFCSENVAKRLHFFTLFALKMLQNAYTFLYKVVNNFHKKSRVFVKTSKQCLGNPVCRHGKHVFTKL